MGHLVNLPWDSVFSTVHQFIGNTDTEAMNILNANTSSKM